MIRWMSSLRLWELRQKTNHCVKIHAGHIITGLSI